MLFRVTLADVHTNHITCLRKFSNLLLFVPRRIHKQHILPSRLALIFCSKTCSNVKFQILSFLSVYVNEWQKYLFGIEIVSWYWFYTIFVHTESHKFSKKILFSLLIWKEKETILGQQYISKDDDDLLKLS